MYSVQTIQGGEVTVHNEHELLGELVEAARLKKNLSRSKLSEQIGVGERHIYAIEHEGGNPSYSVLRKLIYALEISPDDIFYPQNEHTNPKLATLSKAIRRLDDRELNIIKVTVDALLQNRPE
jgi:transcriptional regulator with XRE-family HTH domain